MSLSSILSIAQSALLAQQKALDVTGNNIANASTPGYTRQRLPLSAATPLRTPNGAIGRGVVTGSIERMRDTFLDAAYRSEASVLGHSSTSRDLLQQVEGVVGSLDGTGLGTTIDAFLGAWGDLANNPSSTTARTLLRQQGTALTQQFNALSSRLDTLGGDARARLESTVQEINGLTAQVAGLNGQIVASQSTGGAPDLSDQRDIALDRLSQLIGARVIPHDDGSVGVVVGDQVIADGTNHQDLAVRAQGVGYGVGLASGAGTFNAPNGEVGAIVTFTTTALPAIKTELDQLAAGIVAEVNALHAGGTTNAGATGVNFFAPGGVTAASIALDPAVTGSLANIVTGATAASGDNAVALQIAQLRTTGAASLGGATIGDFYEAIVADVATAASGANQTASAQDTLVSNIEARRSSANGVNLDEEMVSLIRAQQAYAAAARIVSVANEMIDDLLRMI